LQVQAAEQQDVRLIVDDQYSTHLNAVLLPGEPRGTYISRIIGTEDRSAGYPNTGFRGEGGVDGAGRPSYARRRPKSRRRVAKE
ncbi:MAG TPA: hypothetical protein VFW51_01600, partial [Actinomycetota bacterium]|nr:hypothetical protein [Actinomycetota bacterium]